MTTKDNVVSFPQRSNISVCIDEDAERYALVIDFKLNQPDLPPNNELKTEGLGVTLTVWKNGDKPSVGIHAGRGSHDFEDEDVESFRNFLRFALGRCSFAEYEAKLLEQIERIYPDRNPPPTDRPAA